MGAERPDVVVALQAALMRAVGEFGADQRVEPLRARALATAAALDYVLMLATGSAGARIAHDDAQRAIHDGITRGVDDLLACATAIAGIGSAAATRFAHETARELQVVAADEDLATDDRRFALIVLANA